MTGKIRVASKERAAATQHKREDGGGLLIGHSSARPIGRTFSCASAQEEADATIVLDELRMLIAATWDEKAAGVWTATERDAAEKAAVEDAIAAQRLVQASTGTAAQLADKMEAAADQEEAASAQEAVEDAIAIPNPVPPTL